MPDLGPHAVFVWAAYGVTFVTVAVLIAFIVADDRRQRRILAELERQGITRRSAKAPQVKAKAEVPRVKAKAEKPKASRPRAAKKSKS